MDKKPPRIYSSPLSVNLPQRNGHALKNSKRNIAALIDPTSSGTTFYGASLQCEGHLVGTVL